MLDTNSIFLNLLRFDLWPKMLGDPRCDLGNVPCALEKKVYSSAFGWNVLKRSMRYISSNVSFETCVSLLIFCFDDLSIGVSGVLKSPTIIVLLSLFPFMFVSVYLGYWCASMLGKQVLSKCMGRQTADCPQWHLFSSVVQSCPTVCDPMNHSTPGLPIHHQLPESTQTHVHCVGGAIQPSHPLSSPSIPALNLSQHQGLFKWVSSLHQVAKTLEFQLQHQSLQWTPRTDLL